MNKNLFKANKSQKPIKYSIFLVYVIKVGPKFSNDTPVDQVDIQYMVVTDASRLGLSIYARDPMEFYQVRETRRLEI
jgi:hypothetical protein